MNGKTIVITFWTFDILHPWHIYFLSEARKYWDILVTIVARDTNVIKFKKIAPVNDENMRLKNLKDSNIADIVELGDEKNPTKWIEFYNPSIICLGYDQKGFLQDVSSFLEKRSITVKKIWAFKEDIYKSSLLRK